MTEVKVSLEYTNTTYPIDLAELIQEITATSKSQLVEHIEELQQKIILDLCGPKYSRTHPYTRAASYTKTLKTPLGTIQFRVQKIKSRNNNAVSAPILQCLDAKRRRYSKDLRMKLAEYASKMSYQDASLEFETATQIRVPKRTIHRFVHEVAQPLLEVHKQQHHTPLEDTTLMGDSTEVRALRSREMNMVHVLISNSGQLLGFDVNRDWAKRKAKTLVSDHEPGLINAVEARNYQLCILHAIKYLLFTLWGDGMSKDDRLKVEAAAKKTLWTLVNSTKKHLQDKNYDRLQRRIRKTQRALDKIARGLEKDGYVRAADFVFRNGRFMITFALLALQDIKIPYTTNRIERLMGEVSKRCKHKWMHWSTQGLKDILTIILIRYTNRTLYEDFKKAYIHNEIIH